MIIPARRMKSGRICPAFQIDDDLAPKILRFSWHTDNEGYLWSGTKRRGKHRTFSIHQVVYFLRHGYPAKQQIDHINRDKLDNRSENLRAVTSQENMANGGGRPRKAGNKHLPKNVYYWPKNCRSRPYTVYVWVQSRNRFVGNFATVELAVRARDRFLTSTHPVSLA